MNNKCDKCGKIMNFDDIREIDMNTGSISLELYCSNESCKQFSKMEIRHFNMNETEQTKLDLPGEKQKEIIEEKAVLHQYCEKLDKWITEVRMEVAKTFELHAQYIGDLEKKYEAHELRLDDHKHVLNTYSARFSRLDDKIRDTTNYTRKLVAGIDKNFTTTKNVFYHELEDLDQLVNGINKRLTDEEIARTKIEHEIGAHEVVDGVLGNQLDSLKDDHEKLKNKVENIELELHSLNEHFNDFVAQNPEFYCAPPKNERE